MINAKKDMRETNDVKNVTGMCSSCTQQDDCAMTHHGGSNLYGCEEYASLPTGNGLVDYHQEMKAATALGLCATCEQKSQCALKSTPGGVWHCEEYK